MSVAAMHWVWTHSQSVGTDRLVLLAIADRANEDGTDAWPSHEHLVAKTLLSRRTVQRAIARLVEIGELEVMDRRAQGLTNLYTMRMRVDRPRPRPEVDGDEAPDDTMRAPRRGGVTVTPPMRHPDTPGASPGGAPGVSPGDAPGAPLVTHKTSSTSCTSSTPPTRASRGPLPAPLVGRGESLQWDAQQRKLHAGCHPEVCRARDPAVRVCLPSAMAEQLAQQLGGLSHVDAVTDVVAWASADTPPAGYVGPGDAFAHWRHRWAETRATRPERPPRPSTMTPSGRAVPGPEETDALIEELLADPTGTEGA